MWKWVNILTLCQCLLLADTGTGFLVKFVLPFSLLAIVVLIVGTVSIRYIELIYWNDVKTDIFIVFWWFLLFFHCHLRRWHVKTMKKTKGKTIPWIYYLGLKKNKIRRATKPNFFYFLLGYYQCYQNSIWLILTIYTLYNNIWCDSSLRCGVCNIYCDACYLIIPMKHQNIVILFVSTIILII